MPRTRIKICGITRLADALCAAELGADALGFIFYPGSPRFIAPAAARSIIGALPPFVTPVAVMVNSTPEEIVEAMAASGCQSLQLHGATEDALLAQCAFPVIRACSVAVPGDLAPLANYPSARAFLLDTKREGQYGGTGATFDWQLARQARSFGRPIILAGGLTPENVGAAIGRAVPDAVDVNSGIESAPGIKDLRRMRDLFAAVWEADTKG